MIVLFRRLAASHVRRHPGKTLLAVFGIAVGVMTFVAVRAAQDTLASGLRVTVDRLAGRADLQITGVGGVPERLRERLDHLNLVDAEAPVIEQVVQPVATRLGSLLIVGVDLVGDRSIRPYAFAGDDADVDDPLVFLAQPDSIAMTREFATKAGLGKGDGFDVTVGGLVKHFTIRALLDGKGFAGAYGGNVAVTDVYAAEDLFGRGRRFDRIDVRLAAGRDPERAAAEILRAIGPGYRIEAPDQRGLDLERVAAAVIDAFDVVTIIAFGLGLFLIFHIFALGVERRRRDIGILRTCGATPAQVSALFLAEAAILGCIGGAAGVWLGGVAAAGLHGVMDSSLQAVHGFRDETPAIVTAPVAIRGLLLGVIGSLIGAWAPARRAGRVRPAASTSTGVFAAIPEPVSLWIPCAGAVLLGLAWWLSQSAWTPGPLLLPIVIVLGVLGTVAIAGHVAGVVIRAIAPALARLLPAPGRIASNTLLTHPRRTAARSAVLVVTAALALGLAGFLHAVRASIDRWVDSAVLADIVVRASPGFGASALHLAPGLEAQLAAVPGVTAVDVERNQRVDFLGRSVTLVAFAGGGVVAGAPRQMISGRADVMARLAANPGACVVSDVFARRFGAKAADSIALDSPTGAVRLTIAGIVSSFRATILIDRSTFSERWADDRIDTAYVTIAAGADPSSVRDAMRARLGATPALVSTKREVMDEWNRTLRALDVATLATIYVTLAIAVMGSAASLAISAAERASEAGILRAIGATPQQIAVSTVLEALTLSLVSLLLATPLGEALAWFLRTRVVDLVANLRLPAVYPFDVLALLLALLPIVAIASTWMPLRWAAGLGVTEAIAYE